MNKEEKIDEICRKEDGIQKVKDWLVVLFFFAAIAVVVVSYRALSASVNDHGKTAVVTMLVALSVFAGVIVAGYFYNKFLTKKLNKLWEQKKIFKA